MKYRIERKHVNIKKDYSKKNYRNRASVNDAIVRN